MEKTTEDKVKKSIENWKYKKSRDILFKLHSLLSDEKKFRSLTSDTGTMEDGWVVYTLSCKKKDVMKEIEFLKKKHKKGYNI